MSTPDALANSVENAAQQLLNLAVGDNGLRLEGASCDGRDPHFRCELDLQSPDDILGQVELRYQMRLFAPGVVGRCWFANLRSARRTSTIGKSRRLSFTGQVGDLETLQGCFAP